MDRLMTESQKHTGGVSTLTRHKVYSAYNPGQIRSGKYTVTEDWGTACFAHLPAMLKDAVKANGKGVFINSDIVEILFLPHFREKFLKTKRGIQNSLDYLTEVMQFMGVKESAASIILQGWTFKLDRSGSWNVAVCSLIRYLSESPNRVDAYLYMRRTMKLPMPKALYICHFIERDGKVWHQNICPGGHTLLQGRGSKISQYRAFVNWRKQDTGRSILEACEYRGINKLFGNTGGYAEVHGKDSMAEKVRGMGGFTDEKVKQLSKLLVTPRGKKDESTNRKSTRVRKRVRPEEAQLHFKAGGDLELRPGAIHGGIGRRPEPLLIQAAPPDIINPFERSGGAGAVPRRKKTG